MMRDSRLSVDVARLLELVIGTTRTDYDKTLHSLVDKMMDQRQEQLFYECFDDALKQKWSDLIALDKGFSELQKDYCLDELVDHFEETQRRRNERLSLCDKTGSFH